MPASSSVVGKEAKKITTEFERKVLKEIQRYEHRIFQEMDPETAEQLQQSENEVSIKKKLKKIPTKRNFILFSNMFINTSNIFYFSFFYRLYDCVILCLAYENKLIRKKVCKKESCVSFVPLLVTTVPVALVTVVFVEVVV